MIRELVEEVLESLPRPLGEDVIDDVFCAIESRDDWLQRYELWHAEHRCGPQQVGRAVAVALNAPPHIARARSRSREICETYTKLDLSRK